MKLMLVFLVMFLLCFGAFAEKPADLTISGDHSVWVITNDVIDSFIKDTGITVRLIPELAIVGKGCEKGILQASQGSPDRNLGLVCCKLSEQDLNNHNLKSYQIAREPLAIIVNTKNPVSSLSLRQLREIFAGKITNWKDVGGKNEKIVVLTQLHCKQHTPNWMGILNRPERFTKNRVDIKTQPEMAKTVSDFPQAIGHLEMTSVRESPAKVKILAVDGNMPTSENMKKGLYPLLAPLAVITKGNASEKAVDFIRYMRTNEKVARTMEKYGMIQAD